MSVEKTPALLRVLRILQLIPIFPKWVNTKIIHERLMLEGINVSRRTVERDLISLSQIFDLTFGESPEGYKWSYAFEPNIALLSNLNIDKSISIKLFGLQLQNSFIQCNDNVLNALFEKANAVIEDEFRLVSWRNTIVFSDDFQFNLMGNMYSSICAQLLKSILNKNNIRFSSSDVDVQKKVLPVAIFYSNPEVYLLYSTQSLCGLQHIPVSMITSLTPLDKLKTENVSLSFNIEEYLKANHFLQEKITIKLYAKNEAKYLFENQKMVERLMLEKVDHIWSKVEFTARHSRGLETWLLGQLSDIYIESPKVLKESLLQKVQDGIDLNDSITPPFVTDVDYSST